MLLRKSCCGGKIIDRVEQAGLAKGSGCFVWPRFGAHGRMQASPGLLQRHCLPSSIRGLLSGACLLQGRGREHLPFARHTCTWWQPEAAYSCCGGKQLYDSGAHGCCLENGPEALEGHWRDSLCDTVCELM